MTTSSLFRCAVLAVLVPVGVGAQTPLSLGEALQRANASAYANRVAEAGYRAATARSASANQGFLPGVRAEVGAIRTNDPLAGFGFLLRQRAVTPQAFDPSGLNDPEARTDVGAALVAEVPLVNLDAWAGKRAANHAATAEGHRRDWSATGVQLDVIRAYYGAVLAAEKAAVLRAAEAAGRAHMRRAESALRNGLVTRSDLLLAEVRVGEIATQRIGAEADAILARQALALTLGTPGDTAFSLPSAIPVTPVPSAMGEPEAMRSDVAMVASQVDAATADAARRTLGLLPRINGFGRYEWHDRNAAFSGKPMWTVGVMASWSPFSGGAELAARREALANADAARAGLEATEGMAALELAAAESGLRVAEQALTIAARRAVQATEAHRIVERKYEGGLATVAELLEAQATEMGAHLAEAKARHDVIVARGTLARVRAEDLAMLASALDAAAATRE
jgi:outer membrane protein TolC